VGFDAYAAVAMINDAAGNSGEECLKSFFDRPAQDRCEAHAVSQTGGVFTIGSNSSMLVY